MFNTVATFLGTTTMYCNIIKGLLTKVMAKLHICSKICLCAEKDYTNKFSKYQVNKLCGS